MHNIDHHSFAKPEEAIVKHLKLDLNVDFSNKKLSGYAELSIDNIGKGSTLHLDTRELTIDSIWLENDMPTSFELGNPVEFLGSDLAIAIKPTTKKLR